MHISDIRELYKGKTNYVFLGEAGSGKTEIAMSFAMSLAENQEKDVHLFDMDQTKPLFRVRDCQGMLVAPNLTIHYQAQFLDAPTVASGVAECLTSSSCYTLLDVGGGYFGSHMIGQFSDLLSEDNTEIIYIINPYRPWTRARADVDVTMSHVLLSGTLRVDSIIANPNIGFETTTADVLSGFKKVHNILPEYDIKLLTVKADLSEDVSKALSTPIFSITLRTPAKWYK